MCYAPDLADMTPAMRSAAVGTADRAHARRPLGDVLAYWRDAKPEELQAELGGEYLNLSSTPDHLPVIVEKIRNLYLTEPNYTADDLATIKSPTLVLDGELEEFIRLDHVKEFTQAIPGAKLILIPSTGHYAPIQKAADFNKIILDFLKDK